MTWKKILKAPVPLDTARSRDTRLQQKIIDYEKQTIEPALTKLINEQKVGSSKSFTINFTPTFNDVSGYVTRNEYNARSNANMMEGSAYYDIGATALENLGGDTEYIMKTLMGVYRNAGYRDIYINKFNRSGTIYYYIILKMD